MGCYILLSFKCNLSFSHVTMLSLQMFACCMSARLGLTLCNPWTVAMRRLLCPWDFPGKNAEVSCHFLLQGIFLTQGLNPSLLWVLHWQAGFFFSSLITEPPRKPLRMIRRSKCVHLCSSQVWPRKEKEVCSVHGRWLQ